MKKAVVFDNSGTLIERYRVIKDVSNGKLFTDINSLDLIDESDSLALVVLQYNTNKLLDMNQDKLLSEVIKSEKIECDISFTNYPNVDSDEVYKILESESSAVVSDITDGFPILKDKIPNFELCNGSAVILDLDLGQIAYTITSAGKLFPNVLDTVDELKSRGIEIYIASGDRKGAIIKLADLLGVNRDNAFGTVSTKGKCGVVSSLKDEGYKVMMVGDGLNDVLAFDKSDVSVLTTEQQEEVSEKLYDRTDYVISEISEVLTIDF